MNKRITLFLWNEDEAADRATTLRRAGYSVDVQTGPGSGGAQDVRNNPPDVFVIDLGRLPSQGRGVAVWLRQKKQTRSVPIVFIEGDPAKTAVTRKMIPDAEYTGWRAIRGAIRRAIARPPENPVVPGTMDGYAGTPLPNKLGIKAGTTLALLRAPEGFEKTLGTLPDDVTIKKQARGRADVIMLFVRSRADLAKRFPAARRLLAQGGRLWITWPKIASGVVSDLTQQKVREFGLAEGLVDYKISSVDKTWSALCFTQRRGRGR
jgi:CheY-like chemotaxis protein